MKNMMIVCVAAVAMLGCGAYAYEPEVLPSFAKDGAVTWFCYSEGGAMSGMDFAVVVDLERHASGMFTGKQVRVVQAQLPGDGMTVLPADKWSKIVRHLEASDIPSWPDEFSNPTICDGSVWQLNLMKGTNVVRRIWRANDAPPKFREFYKIIRDVDGFEKNRFKDYLIRFIEKHGVEYRAKGTLDDALRDLDRKRGFRFWTDKATGLTWCYRIDEDARIVLGDRTYAKNGCISPSPAGRLVIPDKIGGAPVCEILGEAFAGCSNVTEIVIPASVEKIDDYYHPYCPRTGIIARLTGCCLSVNTCRFWRIRKDPVRRFRLTLMGFHHGRSQETNTSSERTFRRPCDTSTATLLTAVEGSGRCLSRRIFQI